jgi:hypothetical protein
MHECVTFLVSTANYISNAVILIIQSVNDRIKPRKLGNSPFVITLFYIVVTHVALHYFADKDVSAANGKLFDYPAGQVYRA